MPPRQRDSGRRRRHQQRQRPTPPCGLGPGALGGWARRAAADQCAVGSSWAARSRRCMHCCTLLAAASHAPTRTESVSQSRVRSRHDDGRRKNFEVSETDSTKVRHCWLTNIAVGQVGAGLGLGRLIVDASGDGSDCVKSSHPPGHPRRHRHRRRGRRPHQQAHESATAADASTPLTFLAIVTAATTSTERATTKQQRDEHNVFNLLYVLRPSSCASFVWVSSLLLLLLLSHSPPPPPCPHHHNGQQRHPAQQQDAGCPLTFPPPQNPHQRQCSSSRHQRRAHIARRARALRRARSSPGASPSPSHVTRSVLSSCGR